MQEESPQRDECVILIKAQPHRSSRYFETVCCAGVGRDRQWRRQYPVPFRILKEEQKFGRWQWIEYNFVRPKDDKRKESQKVIQKTLVASGELRKSERASFLAPLVKASTREADELGDSLVLVRPSKIRLEALDKSDAEIAHETREHKALANQLSLLEDDEEVQPLTPCRKRFILHWADQDGKPHRHDCDDWETSTAFTRFSRMYGDDEAVRHLQNKYEDQYFAAGLVLGFSTHKRRNAEFGTRNQWLLVGLIRLDESAQGDLLA